MPPFKLGRIRPLSRPPMLRLGNYIQKKLPPPPSTIHYSLKASSGLSMMLANDSLSDCTSAGACHIEDVFRANSNSHLSNLTEEEAIAFYSATTGYIPGDESTDQGANEIDVLNYWREKGILKDGSCKIAGYASLEGYNIEQIKTAVWLFENCYFGVELPDAWLTPADNGFTWDVAGEPNPNNGHCFVGVGYNDIGINICTWGMLGTVTWKAIAKYVTTPLQGELYTVFSEDAVNKVTGKAPNGFNYQQLAADLQTLR